MENRASHSKYLKKPASPAESIFTSGIQDLEVVHDFVAFFSEDFSFRKVGNNDSFILKILPTAVGFFPLFLI